MGVKTSVYLSDELDAIVKASGVPLAEIIRRGVAERGPELEAALLAAQAVRDDVTGAIGAGLRSASADAVSGAHDDMYASAEELLERILKKAFRSAGGGDW